VFVVAVMATAAVVAAAGCSRAVSRSCGLIAS
jgi:hypothetical protein